MTPTLLWGEPPAEPSQARLKEVQRTIEDTGVTHRVLRAAGQSDAAQTLAVDLGISTAVLDPVEGLSEDTEGGHCLTLRRAKLAALEEANGCT